MRKALIAVIVASALFAVGAFAAEFTVQSEDIASGADTVDECLENVDIEFNDPFLNSSGIWVVTEATATFYDIPNADPPSTACDDFDVDLAVEMDGASTQVYVNGNITDGVATFDLTRENTITIPVEDVVGASVAVDNDFLP